MSFAKETQSMATAAELTERLRERIGDYEGLDADPSELKLIKEVHRRFCKLYLYQVSPVRGADLVVKVPIGYSDLAYEAQRCNSAFDDRPCLFERAVPGKKLTSEYAALCRIQSYFDTLNDHRFGVVRVYDLLPEHQAFVIQWIDQPCLRSLLYKTHRFSRPRRSCQLEAAFHHAGAWLRHHHQLPPLSHSETRHTSRDAYLQAVEGFVAYLTGHVSHPESLHQVHQRIIASARDYLPETVATGQLHGDFAPHNIFVDHGNRISVFDTHGRFEAPIYEDIAKMLMAVKASGPQISSRGLLYDRKTLDRFEKCFLEGYFYDQPVPLPAIQLYLAQHILEYWATIVYQHRQQRGIKRVAKRLRCVLWQPGFHDYLREILSVLYACK